MKIVKVGKDSVTVFGPKGTTAEVLKNPGAYGKIKNVSQGFFDSYGVFHPIRSSVDYDESRGDTGQTQDRWRLAKNKKTDKRTVSQRLAGKYKSRKNPEKKYQIVDLGVEHPDYFTGFGTAFSGFSNSVYGIGDTAKEAYDDAVEQVYQVDDNANKLKLPKSPGFSGRTTKAERESEFYYHVGIRWND